MQSDTLAQHQSRWQKAVDGRALWTREAWIDLRLEANKAWSSEELEIFRAQGREPSNYAIIRPVVEATCGIEAQTRSDLKFSARTSQYRDSAEALTYLNKFVDQQNQASRHRSMVFRDAVRTGIGWMELAFNPDPRKEQILKRREDPFNIWLDPTSKAVDLSDALDIFRAKWLYPSYLTLMFPWLKGEMPGTNTPAYDALSHTADYSNREGDRPPVSQFNNLGGQSMMGPGHGANMPWQGQGYATQYSDYLAKTDRYDGLVQVVERWYRVDEATLFARLKNGVVLENTPENRSVIARAVVEGECKLVQAITKRVRCAMFVGDQQILLQDVESPYSHGEFPFIPTWAYQDEEGVPMGLVRALRDPAREFNARRTHLLKRATMRQVHYEDGAFVDEDEAVRELAQFNGAVRYAEGALSGGKVQVRDNLESTQVDAELLSGAAKMVQDMSGMTMETLGQESNAKSGVAIQARQRQGQTNLYSLFDNRNWAQIHEGELTLSLIQDTYTEEQEVRITGSTRGLEYIQINQRDPESGVIVNDITQGRYSVEATQQPESPTERAAKAQVLSDFLQTADPGLRMLFAPQLAELNDLPSDFVEQVKQYVQQQTQPHQQAPQERVTVALNYKDLPDDVKRQAEQEAGFQPSQIPPGAPGHPTQPPAPAMPQDVPPQGPMGPM